MAQKAPDGTPYAPRQQQSARKKTGRVNQDIIIPMVGMVQSLNVSVASALILYEAQRQRQNAGMYLRENSMLPEAEQQRLLFEGAQTAGGVLSGFHDPR